MQYKLMTADLIQTMIVFRKARNAVIIREKQAETLMSSYTGIKMVLFKLNLTTLYPNLQVSFFPQIFTFANHLIENDFSSVCKQYCMRNSKMYVLYLYLNVYRV